MQGTRVRICAFNSVVKLCACCVSPPPSPGDSALRCHSHSWTWEDPSFSSWVNKTLVLSWHAIFVKMLFVWGRWQAGTGGSGGFSNRRAWLAHPLVWKTHIWKPLLLQWQTISLLLLFVFAKEKRKRQTEIEGKRQQLEDQILQLQHFKLRADPGLTRALCF